MFGTSMCGTTIVAPAFFAFAMVDFTSVTST